MRRSGALNTPTSSTIMRSTVTTRCDSLKSIVFAAYVLSLTTCALRESRRLSTTPEPPGAYCQMALAALKETIKSSDAQPYGLEEACVRNRATFSGHVFVDARFGHNWERVPERQCQEGPYVIRFDFDEYQKSPAPEVVLLLFESDTPTGRSFSVAMEEPNWPSKKPGVVALSACGSAFGIVRRAHGVWTATVQPPPRGADEL